MNRRRIKYQLLRQKRLDAEWKDLCTRLRDAQTPTMANSRGLADAPAAEEHEADERRPRACRPHYLLMNGFSDTHGPLLLDADERVLRLLRTVQDVAALLDRLGQPEHADGLNPLMRS